MSITVEIRINGDFEKFTYDGDLNIPVTELLENLGITYSCSCLQGLCGSCAMVINSQPKLACQTFLKDEIMVKEYESIIIEPLSKFPIINALKVDKSRLHDDLIKANMWLESEAKINSDDVDFEYEMSLCLMCGCCVEACPNYDGGDFVGAPVAVSASKIIAQENDKNHIGEIKNSYDKHFFTHCVKSIACEDVCPMGITTQRAISRMNRKAVWKLWRLFDRD